MKAERVVGFMKGCAAVVVWGALPASILSIWGRQIFLDVYGQASIVILLLLPIGFVCAIFVLVCAITALISRKKRDLKIFLYFLAMLLLISAPMFFQGTLIDWGLKWRVEHEPLFAECKEHALPVDDLGFFNVCESNDMSGLATTISFRDIVYDAGGTALLYSDRRPKTFGAFMDSEGAHYNVKKITGNYYVVYSSL